MIDVSKHFPFLRSSTPCFCNSALGSRQGCFYDHPEGRLIDNVHLANVGKRCLNLCCHSAVVAPEGLKKDQKEVAPDRGNRKFTTITQNKVQGFKEMPAS